MEPNLAAIPRHLLADLYLTAKAKAALTRALCPDCWGPLEVIDTWERACTNPACDYVFNLYHWPHVFAPFDPEQGIAPDPKADLTGAPEFLQQAITQTLRDHFDQVVAWRAGTPKTWGFLAGKAVGNARRLAGRNLTDAERRQVWAALWEALQVLHRML